jgi:hypothetical protein
MTGEPGAVGKRSTLTPVFTWWHALGNQRHHAAGVRVLKEADQIACEDTRQTQKLLNHYGISTHRQLSRTQ